MTAGFTDPNKKETIAKDKIHYAVCVLNPDGNSGVSGIVHLKQEQGKNTSIKAKF